MVTVAKCESSLNPLAVGDGGQSRGLVQIYRPAHPTVTDEQAFDPAFSAEFMAKHIKDRPQMWSCWKLTGYPSV